jgi:hypothetical protein
MQAGSQYEKPGERPQPSKNGGQRQVGQVDQPKRAEKEKGEPRQFIEGKKRNTSEAQTYELNPGIKCVDGRTRGVIVAQCKVSKKFHGRKCLK